MHPAWKATELATHSVHSGVPSDLKAQIRLAWSAQNASRSAGQACPWTIDGKDANIRVSEKAFIVFSLLSYWYQETLQSTKSLSSTNSTIGSPNFWGLMMRMRWCVWRIWHSEKSFLVLEKPQKTTRRSLTVTTFVWPSPRWYNFSVEPTVGSLGTGTAIRIAWNFP